MRNVVGIIISSLKYEIRYGENGCFIGGGWEVRK
jgi:hypothetical protein